jgi:hypothetical protein
MESIASGPTAPLAICRAALELSGLAPREKRLSAV